MIIPAIPFLKSRELRLVGNERELTMSNAQAAAILLLALAAVTFASVVIRTIRPLSKADRIDDGPR